jgi:hypothetical protein
MAVNILLLVAWPALAIMALLRLRRRRLPDTAKVLWAILVIAVPILGPVGFWIVDPGKDEAVG